MLKNTADKSTSSSQNFLFFETFRELELLDAFKRSFHHFQVFSLLLIILFMILSANPFFFLFNYLICLITSMRTSMITSLMPFQLPEGLPSAIHKNHPHLQALENSPHRHLYCGASLHKNLLQQK